MQKFCDADFIKKAVEQINAGEFCLLITWLHVNGNTGEILISIPALKK